MTRRDDAGAGAEGTLSLGALAMLPAGVRVRIVRLACAQTDADRLRVLGLFEGAQVRIVDRGSGLLLDV